MSFYCIIIIGVKRTYKVKIYDHEMRGENARSYFKNNKNNSVSKIGIGWCALQDSVGLGGLGREGA